MKQFFTTLERRLKKFNNTIALAGVLARLLGVFASLLGTAVLAVSVVVSIAIFAGDALITLVAGGSPWSSLLVELFRHFLLS